MGIENDLKKSYEDVISVFYDIAQDLNSTFDEKEIVNVALNLLKKVVDYESICYLKYSEKKDMYVIDELRNYDKDIKLFLNRMIREGIIKWAARSGKPFINIEKIGNIKTTVIVPIVQKEELKGAIIIHTKEDENYFDLNKIKILSIISSQLAISFENLSLYKNVEKRNNSLKELKNYLNNIITSMTNGVIVADNNDIIRVFNRKMEDLLKVKSRKILGKKINSSKLDKKFIKYLSILMTKAVKGEKIIDEEFEYTVSEENLIPLGISATQLKQKGKDLGIIFVIRDLSESKELQELKRIDKLKDEFLSMVSHELRTPLTSIKAYTETLLFMVEDNESEESEELKEFLNIINEESERLTRLINDVLDLSKIEAGKMSFILKEEDPVVLIETSMRNMVSSSDSKKIEFCKELDEDLPLVLIDKDRTLQVLANLINNAVKFTPEKGKITIIAKKYNEKFIVVTVKDTGRGIIKEEQNMVFEKFKQSEDILTREVGGTGLGLPICKNIIEYYGGNIWVESEFEKGSEFKFTLPISENMEGENQ